MGVLDTGVLVYRAGQIGPQPGKLTLTGKDNYGNPRQDFADRLAMYSDEELRNVCEQYIWLSAYAANNYRSDYHWMCDACYAECVRRGTEFLYDSAWHRASGM